MEIQTERLVFKEISVTDLHAIHKLHSYPETDQFNTLGLPATIKDTEQVITEWLGKMNNSPRERYVCALQDRNNISQLIGLIGLNMGKPAFKNAEVWYKIDPAYWGKGIATEAVKAILEFAFTRLKLHRVEAGCATGNIASKKVMEKAGMKLEGMKRGVLPIRGTWTDAFSFAILDEDFSHVSSKNR